MKEKWITIQEATKLLKPSRGGNKIRSEATIRYFIREGIFETKQLKKRGRIYINWYSIPTFLRK